MTLKLISIYIFSIFYISIGIKHFTDLNYFLKIMPPYLPLHKELVYLSGLFEIIFGVMLLFNKTRLIAAWGLILLLIAVFPANIYLAQTNGSVLDISAAVAWWRLPFQAVFIGFAYWHSRI